MQECGESLQPEDGSPLAPAAGVELGLLQQTHDL